MAAREVQVVVKRTKRFRKHVQTFASFNNCKDADALWFCAEQI